MPYPATKNCTFYLWVLQTIEKSHKIGNNTVHDFLVLFSRRGDKIKLLILHLCIRTTATVNQYLHLSTHSIKIYRRPHDNYICCKHLANNLCSIVLLWTRFLVLATHTTSCARVDSLISQKDFFYLIFTFYGSAHEFVAKRVRITT